MNEGPRPTMKRGAKGRSLGVRGFQVPLRLYVYQAIIPNANCVNLLCRLSAQPRRIPA